MGMYDDGGSSVILETAPDRDERRRREYEAWIVASRKQARRERIYKRVTWGVAILITLGLLFGLMVYVNQATAAPPPQERELRPKPRARQGVPVEQSPRSLKAAEAYCEKAGGFWWVDMDPDGLPGMKVVGCLWPVPKGMK